MKIRKLTFRNINCLKGDHEINFDEEPLKDSGIFAITGPTGSGKSTILDVISLALYNRVPRFGKSISKSTIEDRGTVLTLHCKDAYANIEYMVDNKLYTSSWKVRKSNSGNLQKLHMDIYDHNAGTHLDLKPSEVPKKNEDIIKLDFDQFVKSIVLSQGQFSKFLKSDKSERGKLLEKITGLKIYRKLGIAAFQKKKTANANVDRMMDRLGEITILEEEDKKEISKSIAVYKKQILEKEKQIKEKETQIEVHKNLQKINQEIKVQEQNISSHEKTILNFAPKLVQLIAYDKIAPLAGELAILKKSNQEKEAKKYNTEKYNKKIKDSKTALESSMQKMADLCKEDVDVENFMTVMSKFEKDINKMDHQLESLKKRGQQKRAEINKNISSEEFSLKLELSPNKNIQPEDAILSIKKTLPQLKETLKEAKISKDHLISKIDKDIETDLSNFQQLEKIKLNYAHLKERIGKIAEDKKQLSKIESNKAAAKAANKKFENQLKEFKKHEVEVQKKREDSIKLFELVDYRKDLKEGEACPLCGSKNHPYAKHVESDASGLDAELKRVKEAIEKLSQDASKAKNSMVEASTKYGSTQAAIVENEKHLNEENLTLDKLKSAFKASLSTEEDDIENSIQLLKKNLALKKKAKSALAEIKILQKLLEDFNILNGYMIEYKDLDKTRKIKFEGENATAVCNEIQNQFSEAKGELKENTALHKKESTELKKLSTDISQSEEKLNKSTSKLGFSSIAEVYASFMEKEELIKTRAEKEALDNEQTKLQTELKGLKINLEKTRKELKDPKISMEILQDSLVKLNEARKEIADLPGQQQEKLSENEKNLAKMKKYQKELDALNKEKEKWGLLDKYIGDASGNSFANYAQGLTLQNLLVLANHRLKELSERYLLIKPENDGPLMVMDQYQGNITRAVNTLSGGESFIISLALALSLSDMASKNISIESLFIDEGFGTLDSETLDIAMNTLERLQTESQKTVGVISHIPTIKERINVQIQLNKNSQGYSQINIVN